MDGQRPVLFSFAEEKSPCPILSPFSGERVGNRESKRANHTVNGMGSKSAAP